MEMIAAAGAAMAANPMMVLGAVATVGSSVMQMSAAASQAAALKAKAQQALIQSRSDVIRSRGEELKHKRAGNLVLAKMNRTLATVTAYAGQAVDPFSGSVNAIASHIMTKGYDEYGITRDSAAIERENRDIIKFTAQHQASSYRKGARQAVRMGYISAGVNLAQGAAMTSMLYTPAAGQSLGQSIGYQAPSGTF
jgi:hypothetical protein